MALGYRAALGMPPDGAGKKFNVAHVRQVHYINATSLPTVNDAVSGQTSGLSGIVMQLVPETSTAGMIYIAPAFSNIASEFIVGENIIDENSNVLFEVDYANTDMFTQRAQIVGGNNQFNAQFVDRQGAASVRFAEGSTQFDGFGRMNVANITLIGDYQSHYGISDSVWDTALIGGGDSQYLAGHAGTLLSTSTGGTDKASITTLRNHPYQAGTGQLIFLTAYANDAGKAGVVRRWGYFDDNDGLFFQLDENGMSVVTRSNVTGSLVERVVAQNDWNYDKLNGLGTSQFNLDPTKHNLYWIDFAWLGVGAVRFGVYGADGARLVAHVVQNGNIRQEPYMSNPRLPVRYEIENTTSQGTTSELFAGCASVQIEGTLSKQHIPMGGADIPTKTVTGAGITPLAGLRSALTYNGSVNKIIAMPKSLDVHAFLNGTDTPARVKLLIMRSPTGLTNSTWIQPPFNPNSSLEFDPGVTGTVTDGYGVLAELIYGDDSIVISEYFDLLADEFLGLRSNGEQVEYYLCARPVDPTDSIDVTVAVNWSEI